jgi:hypothetical protein
MKGTAGYAGGYAGGKMINIQNPEKKEHESWTAQRKPFDFPRPFRWVILAEPNAGKTTMILNYLINASHFNRIFLLHPRSFNPEVPYMLEAQNMEIILESCEIPEYTGVEFYPMQYIPNEKFFEGIKGHSLFIIDDIDLLQYSKGPGRARVINKFFSYVSTHSNVSIIVTSQSPSSQLPTIIFQMANIVTLFRMTDKYKIRTLAQKMGTNSKSLEHYLSLCKNRHDSITFDYIEDSPMPVRKNIFENIESL